MTMGTRTIMKELDGNMNEKTVRKTSEEQGGRGAMKRWAKDIRK